MSKAESVEFPPPPKETDYNEQVDATMTQLLNEFVNTAQLVETVEQQSARRDVLQDLEQKISQWVYETYKDTNIQWMTSYRANDPSSRLAFIQPYGSYYLQTHTPSSDIDSVVVFPCYVNETTFFEIFSQQLKQSRDVTRADAIVAKFSVLNVVYKGIEIDLQPAILSQYIVSRNIDWLDSKQFDNCKQRTKEVIAAVSTNVKLKNVMGVQFPMFQQLVRILKHACDQLMINGNKIGYFGGINVAILAANLMLISKNRQSLCQLVYNFFAYYGKFSFGSKPIIICEEVGYQPMQAPMQIVTLTKPEINSTSKVTESTKYVIQKQFKSCRRSMEYLMKLISNCLLNPVTKALIKPQVISIIFSQLIDPKPSEDKKLQVANYTIDSHQNYFFKDPDFKAGIMTIQINHPDDNIVKKTQDKIEPMLVMLFNDLEKIKTEVTGQMAKIQYIRPRPSWDITPGQMVFYVGLCKTPGEKEWLAKKLNEIIVGYKIKLRNKMEKEEIEIQKCVLNLQIGIKSGKDILKTKQAAQANQQE
ncbi:Poly(A)_polymerase [Hexamita inflata]|uniref:polynucleotide adenylyltransferase n=1 Tax=Hexamita inflata TaxID=28002 RepID=A0AA86TV15_9EUKA|nr:Poly(A) polymerase [Hexamita inflata]